MRIYTEHSLWLGKAWVSCLRAAGNHKNLSHVHICWQLLIILPKISLKIHHQLSGLVFTITTQFVVSQTFENMEKGFISTARPVIDTYVSIHLFWIKITACSERNVDLTFPSGSVQTYFLWITIHPSYSADVSTNHKTNYTILQTVHMQMSNLAVFHSCIELVGLKYII